MWQIILVFCLFYFYILFVLIFLLSASVRHLTIYFSSFSHISIHTHKRKPRPDSPSRDTLGLSTEEGKLPRKSLSASLDIVKSLCRSSECVELEVIYDYLWDKWGLGEAAGAAKGTRIVRACHHRKTIEWLGRLQVSAVSWLARLLFEHKLFLPPFSAWASLSGPKDECDNKIFINTIFLFLFCLFFLFS